MSKKGYPLWLRVALRLPLSWKHRIRAKLEMAEYWSTKLVIEDGVVLCGLIENTDTPDFEAFNQRLEEVRKAWGKYDAHIEAQAVRGRLQEFKWEQRGRLRGQMITVPIVNVIGPTGPVYAKTGQTGPTGSTGATCAPVRAEGGTAAEEDDANGDGDNRSRVTEGTIRH